MGMRSAFDFPSSKSNRVLRPICPHTKHLIKSMEVLEDAYEELESFHNDGGNLQSIQQYLTDEIDHSYHLLGITFTPEGSTEPLPKTKSISKEVRKILKKSDATMRGGYNQRELKGGQFNPSDNPIFYDRNQGGKIDVIEPFTIQRWEHSLGPVIDLCQNLTRFTPPDPTTKYEEKYMCSFPGREASMSDQTAAIEQDGDSCQIISIGSNGEWTFEKIVTLTSNCHSHTFDCTRQHDPKKPNIPSVHFYPFCIGNEERQIRGRTYLPYSKIIDTIGLSSPPKLLKMDIEGFEYGVFLQMLEEAEKSNTSHLLPSQVSVELHYSTRMYDLPWNLRRLQAGEISLFAGVMFRKGGYLIVHTNFDPECNSCIEVLFVRVFCDYLHQ